MIMKRKNYSIEFPERWEEVTQEEWIRLLHLREEAGHRPSVSLLDVRRNWCRCILDERGISPFFKRTAYCKLLDDLSDTLDWAVTETDGEITVRFDSTVNLIPSYEGFTGPASHGADLTFAQFRDAAVYAGSYEQTADGVFLERLADTLYLKKADGKHTYDRRNVAVTGFPTAVNWGIYAWFAAFCNALRQDTFCIDGSEVSFAPLFRNDETENGTEKGESLGLDAVLFAMAESQVFGDCGQVERTPVLMVFLKLLADLRRVEAIKKETKRRI